MEYVPSFLDLDEDSEEVVVGKIRVECQQCCLMSNPISVKCFLIEHYCDKDDDVF